MIMELGSSSLHPCASITPRPTTILPPLSFSAHSPPSHYPFPSLKSKAGCRFYVNNPVGWRIISSLPAGVAGSTTEVLPSSSNTSTSSSSPGQEESSDPLNENDDDDDDDDDDVKYVRACDKLIGIFMVDKPTPSDWRVLLASSKQWDTLRPHFFARCQERAHGEQDPEMQHKLLRLARKLRDVDEDVKRHNELLGVVKAVASEEELRQVVARRRKDFTKEFFEHLYTVAHSNRDNPTEQKALEKVGNDCLAAVQASDRANAGMEALSTAALKFKDILSSPSLEAACGKIDALAQKNQLDSATFLLLSKAWSAAKETDMTTDELKDTLYHLYMTALAKIQRDMPVEVRIIKYVLTIEDPVELLCNLKDAFTPGEVTEGKDRDYLYTTPEKLHTWIKSVVDAYHLSREGTLLREARDMMNPNTIKRLEQLQKLIEDNFM